MSQLRQALPPELSAIDDAVLEPQALQRRKFVLRLLHGLNEESIFHSYSVLHISESTEELSLLRKTKNW